MEAQTTTAASAPSRRLPVALTAVLFGAGFGFLLSWGQFTSPDRIREMLLVEDLYLYEMMFTAMVVGFIGLTQHDLYHTGQIVLLKKASAAHDSARAL